MFIYGNKNGRTIFVSNFWKKKNKENIALLKNKKFEKACFEPFEHISYLIFFRCIMGGIMRDSLSNFCPGSLINQVGMFVMKKVKVVINND